MKSKTKCTIAFSEIYGRTRENILNMKFDGNKVPYSSVLIGVLCRQFLAIALLKIKTGRIVRIRRWLKSFSLFLENIETFGEKAKFDIF